MGIFHGTCEIIELSEGLDSKMMASHKHSIVADINKRFETIDNIKTLTKEKYTVSSKNAMKRPVIADSEDASLKHALRGLCISQASETAANKRSSNPTPLSADTIKMLYKTLVIEPGQSEHSFDGIKKRGNSEDVFRFPQQSSSEMDFSQSSKSSNGGYSSTTSISDEENSWKDMRWQVISSFQKEHGRLRIEDFKILKMLNYGDISAVYLVELIGTNCWFGLKVESEIGKGGNEKEIMQMLDHPFLPTLYSHFVTYKMGCLLMEYCPEDLHALRLKQPAMSFSEEAARFYTAEVLLALEYLHAHGITYQNLKPKNILVREDGHIMLTNFEFSSKRIATNPSFLKQCPPPQKHRSCIDPSCLFTPLSRKLKRRSIPISEDEYGNRVDWWALGEFLYELLYGKPPLKGFGSEERIEFCADLDVSSKAKDLMKKLMVKEGGEYLGSVNGGAEIKKHSFFEEFDWTLLTPPYVPTKEISGDGVF